MDYNQGPIDITIINDEGQEVQVTPGQIQKDLNEMGYQVTGFDASGMKFHFSDPRGDYSLPVSNVMQALGHQVKMGGITPKFPDESGVRLAWRAAISKLPDDDAKKAYLESKLRREGVEQPMVEGSGRNWWSHDPQRGWLALTNKQSWHDTGDLTEAALEVPAMAGSTAGMVGGAGLGSTVLPGAGTVIGAGLGSAAGNAVGDAAVRGTIAAIDPDYRNAASFGQQAKDVGYGSIVPGVLGSLGATAGKIWPAAKAVSEEGLSTLQKGSQSIRFPTPVSGAVEGTGRVLRGAGGVTREISKAADTPIGREIVKAAVPGMNQIYGLAQLAQLPRDAVTIGPKAISAGSRLAEEAGLLSPELAQRGVDFGKRLAAPRGTITVSGDTPLKKAGEGYKSLLGKAEEKVSGMSRGLMGQPQPIGDSASDVLANVSEGVRSNLPMKKAKSFISQAQEKLDPQGMFDVSEDAPKLAQSMAEEANKNSLAKAGRAGQKVGRALDTIAKVGETVDKGLNAVVGAGAKTGKAVGGVMREAGRGMEMLGTAAKPFELQGYNIGAKELLLTPEERAKLMYDPVMQRRYQLRRGSLPYDSAGSEESPLPPST